MFPPSDSGDGHGNRALVSLLQEEHVHQWEICRWQFLQQTQHTHPVSARRSWGEPSLLPGTASYRLPRCYQEHQALLYEHKVSTHTFYLTALSHCLITCPLSLGLVLKLLQSVSQSISCWTYSVPKHSILSFPFLSMRVDKRVKGVQRGFMEHHDLVSHWYVHFLLCVCCVEAGTGWS